MSSKTAAIGCKKPECPVATTGECAEGHATTKCPNYISQDDEEIEGGDDHDDKSSDRVPLARLPSGEALTPEDVEVFLRWRPAKFVSIVGDSFSGKTTLVCALYDRFLRGPFAGFGFVGSRTLMALEKRSYYSRVDSGLAVPDTARTSIADGLRFFHVSVAPAIAPATPIELLISDRAGELYRQARANSDRVRELIEVMRADRVVILLDGGRLANIEDRASALQGARQMIRALLDNGAIGGNAIVQLVTTKFDLVQSAPDRNDVITARTDFHGRLTADFAHRLAELSFWDVAARAPSGALPPAHGLDVLFQDWMKPRTPDECVTLPKLALSSEFDRLLARTPEDTA
jgi:hypothetical protein